MVGKNENNQQEKKTHTHTKCDESTDESTITTIVNEMHEKNFLTQFSSLGGCVDVQ